MNNAAGGVGQLQNCGKNLFAGSSGTELKLLQHNAFSRFAQSYSHDIKEV